MNLKQGEIILVPFPFTDLSSKKTRPALVISNTFLKGDDIILCGISSQASGNLDVEITSSDMSSGGLPLKSYVKLGKLVTLNKKIVIGVLGSLSTKKYKEIRSGILQLLK